ncbi:MAG TPA: bifunctional phosphoribosyl-AMP cyclohydrolase/phosphoribosyl-ATP diphosphatase HisIE [Gemmatimonadaceae bacterium]|nr:bifunctional phosphoribosyl-AMP cyclohydrolase/phosphoribosyl-ATP diphosphatase HisIE [Gemmatimonadaceae bacterium]
MPNADLRNLDFAKGSGLVTVIAQDAVSGAVLMVAHADRDAVERSVARGEMHYFSRTRGPWHKGATSGNTQRLVSLSCDCDADALLARVVPAGPACHTGAYSCFGNLALEADAFGALSAIIRERATGAPVTGGKSYTAQLLGDRNLRLKKIGEEAAELIAACADRDASRAADEAADLIYHIAVALQAAGSSLDDARAVLAARRAPID